MLVGLCFLEMNMLTPYCSFLFPETQAGTQTRAPRMAQRRRYIMSNTIFAIMPYKWNGLWVFDDPAVGLTREPLVGGTDTMIDVATEHLPDARKGFVAVFSAGYFPDARIVLDLVRGEGGGSIYRWKEKEMQGWLCPALLRYFPEPPAKLFIQVKAAKED
jgi:hypothetical protein